MRFNVKRTGEKVSEKEAAPAAVNGQRDEGERGEKPEVLGSNGLGPSGSEGVQGVPLHLHGGAGEDSVTSPPPMAERADGDGGGGNAGGSADEATVKSAEGRRRRAAGARRRGDGTKTAAGAGVGDNVAEGGGGQGEPAVARRRVGTATIVPQAESGEGGREGDFSSASSITEEAAAAAAAARAAGESAQHQGEDHSSMECSATASADVGGQCVKAEASSAVPPAGGSGGGDEDVATDGAPHVPVSGASATSDGGSGSDGARATGVDPGIESGGGATSATPADSGVEPSEITSSAPARVAAAVAAAAAAANDGEVADSRDAGLPPSKPSRTLADAAAFVEAEGRAADAAYADALNAAQSQEVHQAQAPAAVYDAERALAALAAAALQPRPGVGVPPSAAAGGAGGAGAAPGVTIALADGEEHQHHLHDGDGDCTPGDEGFGVWRQLQTPHMAFIQCQLAVLGSLILMILICWRRHGRMISVLYAAPADVATQCHAPSTP